jgi:hypothetical protein
MARQPPIRSVYVRAGLKRRWARAESPPTLRTTAVDTAGLRSTSENARGYSARLSQSVTSKDLSTNAHHIARFHGQSSTVAWVSPPSLMWSLRSLSLEHAARYSFSEQLRLRVATSCSRPRSIRRAGNAERSPKTESVRRGDKGHGE